MDNQHSFLKIFVPILKIVSYGIAALGIFSALIILFGKTPGSGKLASLGVLIIAGLWFLVVFFVSEVIRLFLIIDERLQKIESSVQTPKREIR